MIPGGKGGCGGNSIKGFAGTDGAESNLRIAYFGTKTMSPGIGGKGGNGGRGPGAGGNGGGGGAGGTLTFPNAPTNGTPGYAPDPLSYGGDGGDGGTGGGMVYMRVFEITKSVTGYRYIVTTASTGTDGTNAFGDGGKGGAGGRGGKGGCNSGEFHGPGGGGGHGTPGNGADGGDGGNGGNGGDIWCLVQNGTISSSDVKMNGGSFSLGGLGTWHGDFQYYDPFSGVLSHIHEWDPTNNELCPPYYNGNNLDGCNAATLCSPCNNPVDYGSMVKRSDANCDLICDGCDDAFWLLSMMQSQINFPNGIVKYYNPVPSRASAEGITTESYCIKNSKGLSAWYIDIVSAGSCTDEGDANYRGYFCDMDDPTNPIWTQLTNGGAATSYVYGSSIQWTGTGIGSTGIVDYSFSTNTVVWDPGSETGCTTGSGGAGDYSWDPKRPRNGLKGRKGEPGASGGFTLSSDVSGWSSSGNSWKRGNVGLDQKENLGFTLSPNPAHSDVNFTLQNINSTFQVAIYNMKGELVLFQNYNGKENGLYRMDISGLSIGTYIFHLKNHEFNFHEKLVIE